MEDFALIDSAFTLSRCLFAIGSIVWGIEYLSLREQFSNQAILSWDIGRLRYVWSSRLRPNSSFDLIFGRRAAIAFPVARIIIGVLLLIPAVPLPYYALGLGMAAIVSISWFLRTPQGQDGSDQIFLLVAVALACAYGFDSATMYAVASLFISLQLTICYVTAGLSKLISREWRSGVAITHVFRTYNYGSPWIFKLASGNKSIALSIAWFVIGFELLFPIVFLTPAPAKIALLTVPLIFHLGTAIFMGLNLFLVSFLSAYPLLILVLLKGPLLQD
jgi:hypothetical protein